MIFFWNIMRIYFLSNVYHENLKHKWHIQDKNKGKQLSSSLSELDFMVSWEQLEKSTMKLSLSYTQDRAEKMFSSRSFDLQALGHISSVLIDVRYI